MHSGEVPMRNVKVVCQSCGRVFTYPTMFLSTMGVAVCPYCGVRDGATTPRCKLTPPVHVEGGRLKRAG
jgi:rRNA maturation endonuclease Nob1